LFLNKPIKSNHSQSQTLYYQSRNLGNFYFSRQLETARKYMPRLVGKKNNSALNYGGLGFLIAVVGAVALEYFGVIDLIPNFGKETEVKTTTSSFEKGVTKI
jgi:hypothetical protein